MINGKWAFTHKDGTPYGYVNRGTKFGCLVRSVATNLGVRGRRRRLVVSSLSSVHEDVSRDKAHTAAKTNV